MAYIEILRLSKKLSEMGVKHALEKALDGYKITVKKAEKCMMFIECEGSYGWLDDCIEARVGNGEYYGFLGVDNCIQLMESKGYLNESEGEK